MSCKRSDGAVKKIEIWKLPAILLVALSRFSFIGMLKDKRENYIDYPVGYVSVIVVVIVVCCWCLLLVVG